jgi:hypothetical protein
VRPSSLGLEVGLIPPCPTHLLILGQSPEARRHAEVVRLGELARLAVDLLGELARGRDDERDRALTLVDTAWERHEGDIYLAGLLIGCWIGLLR